MIGNISLGPLEKNVMDCVWREEIVSVKDVHSCLKKSRKIAYTTVMTVMTRLTEKGLLKRKKHGKAFIYSPKRTREQTAKKMIGKIIDSLVDQFGEEAVVAFSDELEHQKRKK
jgi:predicted transcriptional regulator